MRHRDWIIVIVACLGVAAYALGAAGTSNFGFPLDDSWIHQTYGRNLALTGQWAYVPGIPSAGSTSPFFTVLLATGYALHVPYFLWTYGLGALALALMGLIAARMAERLYPGARGVGLWTGLGVVVAWHLVWAAASGMETALFTMLSLLVMVLAFPHPLPPSPPSREGELGNKVAAVAVANLGWKEAKRGALFGAVGAILIATRPEGGLLVGLVVLLVIIACPQGSWRRLAFWMIGAFVGGLIFITPYALLNLSLNGTMFPNTVSAKQAENAALLAQPFVVNLWAMIQPLTAGGQALLVPGATYGLILLVRRIRANRAEVIHLAPLIWSVALILLYTWRLPAFYQHGRYVIPAVAPFIVFGAGGTLLLASRRRASLIGRVLSRTLALAAVGIFIFYWPIGEATFAHDVSMINSDMLVASRWLSVNIPADQAHLLALHDIGAVGYFAPRPMLDLAGLVSPEVVPIIRDGPALMKLMEQRGVRYLMALPTQLPTTANDPRLCLRFNANGGMGGMAIYEMAWNGHCVTTPPKPLLFSADF